jgi:hypothetical protein
MFEQERRGKQRFETKTRRIWASFGPHLGLVIDRSMGLGYVGVYAKRVFEVPITVFEVPITADFQDLGQHPVALRVISSRLQGHL